VRVPAPADIAGSWEGHVIFLTRPDISLLNQLNPVDFRMRFVLTTNGAEARYRFGLGAKQVQFTSEYAELIELAGFRDEIRLIDNNTLIGKCVPGTASWLSDSALRTALEGYLDVQPNGLAFFYLLTRAV